MSCEEDILVPLSFMGDDRHLKTNGSNRMLAPFKAIQGTKEEPSYSFQQNSRTGFYLDDEGKIWVTENGKITYPLEYNGGGSAILTVSEKLTGTPDGVLTDFTATYSILEGTEIVSVNGIIQDSEHYTIDGDTVTFADPPDTDDTLRVVYTPIGGPEGEIGYGFVNWGSIFGNILDQEDLVEYVQDYVLNNSPHADDPQVTIPHEGLLNILAGQPVAIVGSGAERAGTLPAVGVATTSQSAGAGDVTVQLGGILELDDWTDSVGSVNLVGGSWYYLNPLGGMTMTPPEGSRQPIGVALSNKRIVILTQSLGGGVSTFEDLIGVDLDTPVSGQTVFFDGSGNLTNRDIEMSDINGLSDALDDLPLSFSELTGVDESSPVAGQTVFYNSSLDLVNRVIEISDVDGLQAALDDLEGGGGGGGSFNGEVDIEAPLTPSTGHIRIAGYNGARPALAYLSDEGRVTKLQTALDDVHVGIWSSPGNTTTAPTPIGMSSITVTGTAAARNWTATNSLTRTRRMGYTSTGGTSTQTIVWLTAVQNLITSDGTIGGFYVSYLLAITDPTYIATARMFWGLRASVANPTNTDPAGLTNCFGIAQLPSDSTQLFICYGGSSAQTPIGLGMGIPPSSNKLLRVIFYCPQVANKLYYEVENITDGNIVMGEINGTGATDFPQPTTALNPLWAFRANNGTAAALGLDLSKVYIEAPIY